MSDSRKEAEEKMAKAIFISGDCWLCVFDLLTPSQLGLGIALISHRFDFYVDEHFKTRKWKLGAIRIGSKIGKNGTKEMEIVNYDWKPLPIPQNEVPHKVIGFRRIIISYIDRNAIVFLGHFRPLFAVCRINLFIGTDNDRISEFILRNIWPMLGKNIHGIEMSATFFRRLRQMAPSINDCPSLRIINAYVADFLIEFPADDYAMASDGQAVAKWLFTPLQNNVPKVFKFGLATDAGSWSSSIEAIKAAFGSASSPVNFIVVIWTPMFFADSVVPFDLTNKLTHEQLALKRIGHHLLLTRSLIARDKSKWTKWEGEAIDWTIDNQWNRIDIQIYGEDKIGEGLLDATPGPSDQQQK